MVTPDPPVKTVKNAESIAQTTAVPPGNHPNHARNTFRSLSGALPSASKNPQSVNNGIDASVGFTASW